MDNSSNTFTLAIIKNKYTLRTNPAVSYTLKLTQSYIKIICVSSIKTNDVMHAPHEFLNNTIIV